jgi:ankyrin repeat protein
VALLLDNGADVNAVVKDGRTPLHLAARFGHREVVELLLKHGADKTVKVSRGEATGLRPVDIARQEGHTALIPLLEP